MNEQLGKDVTSDTRYSFTKYASDSCVEAIRSKRTNIGIANTEIAAIPQDAVTFKDTALCAHVPVLCMFRAVSARFSKHIHPKKRT